MTPVPPDLSDLLATLSLLAVPGYLFVAMMIGG